MKSDSLHPRLRALPSILRHVCLFGVFVVGVAKAWPKKSDGSTWLVVSFLAQAADWLLPGLAVGAASLEWWAKGLRGNERWPKVRRALEFFQAEVFEAENKEGDPVDENRVTLFQKQWVHIRWRYYCLPSIKTNVLVAVERSGDQTRVRDVTFHIPDEGKKNLGVAGQAWRMAVELYIDQLPDVSGESRAQKDIKDYALKTFTSEERVVSRMPSARSFVAFPIWVDSKKWGTIVLDSRRPRRRDTDSEKKLYRAASFVLSSLLSKGEKP